MNQLTQEQIESQRDFQRAYFEGNYGGNMQPGDTNYIRRQVRALVQTGELRPGQHVLDVGCGFGRYTLTLAREGLSLEGLDLAQKLLDQFRANDAGRYNIPLHCADILEPPADLLARFDAVIGFFTLHHLHDLAACFASMKRLLKPGGQLVFLEPNPLNALYYIQLTVTPGMSWQGEKGILNMRDRKLAALLAEAGFESFQVHRFGFFPPVIVNRPWGLYLEERLEKFPLWNRLLPFQIFKARLR